MKEGAGGIVAVDQVDEGIGRAEGRRFAFAGGFDEAGAAGAVDGAEADGCSAGFEGEVFGA